MDLRIHILRKLFRHRYIGGKHTDIANLLKSIPSHERGNAKESVYLLIREGYLMTKPTSYGLHVSLNPVLIDEITKMIEATNNV